jgi:hypothetical protein
MEGEHFRSSSTAKQVLGMLQDPNSYCSSIFYKGSLLNLHRDPVAYLSMNHLVHCGKLSGLINAIQFDRKGNSHSLIQYLYSKPQF